MEVECQGCFYTLCSFVCLTEHLYEIQKFLWQHGCLRRSYSCEKCGRKCAIGDKDLFFRCNRNTLDKPNTYKGAQNLSTNSDNQIDELQRPSHIHDEVNEGVIFKNEDIHREPHVTIPPASSEISQQGSSVLHSASISENCLFVSSDGSLQPAELSSHKTVQTDTANCNYTPSSVLNLNELNHSEQFFHVFKEDSKKRQILEIKSDNSSIAQCQNSRILVSSGQQLDSINENEIDLCSKQHKEIVECEARAKVLIKPTKKEGRKKLQKKRCNFKVSMKKGTFFEKSKLPIDTVCKFVGFWCCMKHPTQEFLRNELSLAPKTVVDWSSACRDICIHWAKSVSEKIGGDGVMVQVDEVRAQDGKESKQSDDSNRFSFWGMEKDKENGKIFIVSVTSCDTWNLLNIVSDWILPGSVIISNCWKAYDCLKLKEFVQQTVVQSKTFVHPCNNAGRQNFDRKVEETGLNLGSGELNMPKFGTRRSHYLGDLAEFMFKRRYSNHLERIHVFFKQISKAYPLR